MSVQTIWIADTLPNIFEEKKNSPKVIDSLRVFTIPGYQIFCFQPRFWDLALIFIENR